MRLHHLEVTAFGPFKDRTSVDFDGLASSGLFLLTGPTGAGKSSVLDAVCFALYGDVPGDRGGAKRLRCDTAPADVAPRVHLEATLSGRRFRIERSPAWKRPKRRGTGTTTEQARVVISEHVDGAWTPRSTRLDETGHLVTQLVGMNLTQFCQVALLPQGRFQAFLRARSEERHALLQQVFRTGRFDDIEKWLRERRNELRRESATHEETIADLVSRVSEVSGQHCTESWEEAPATLPRWLETLRANAQETVTTQAASSAQAEAELARVQQSHHDALRLDDLVTRGTQAQHDRTVLETASPGVEDARGRLADDARAATIAPLLRLADSTARSVVAAEASDTAAREALIAALGAGTPHDAGHSVDAHVTAALDEWRGLAPLVTDLPAREAALTRADAAVVASREQVDTLSRRAAQIPTEVLEARATVSLAETRAAEATRLDSLVAELAARAAAHKRATGLLEQLATARVELQSLQAERVEAKEEWLQIREARLDGMAAEIASGLAVGHSCPVCGSHEHPSPATAGHGAPDADAERLLRKAVDDLEVMVEVAHQQVRDVETRLAVARAEAGDDPDQLSSALEQARSDLDEASHHHSLLPAARATLSALEDEASALSGMLADARVALAGHQHTLAGAHAHVVEACLRIDAAASRWGLTDHGDLTSYFAALAVARDRADEATKRLVAARQALADATATAELESYDAGFASLADAAAAVLSESERVSDRTMVDEHDSTWARVTAILEDPAVRDALMTWPRPDVTLLATALDDARQHAAEAHRNHDRAVDVLHRLTSLDESLTAAHAAWEPVRDQWVLTASLASFVEGKSPDNRLHMRLSAYVLAHRLSQVVDAANVRLWSMSSQRYALIHTGQKGSGETRGGLSLQVRDAWNGESRDPATLSGGESFVVSLALALGLADVIAHEAGGADLHTLFVDEGFGALDAETLDDVMDVLDELRDGGRVVGVVSHVPELKTRIPTQLRVTKGRDGSGVSLRVG